MEIRQSEGETCRLENVGKFAVPICGHDVLTEFMVQDLKKGDNKGIMFYGGLFADEPQDRFFWYVSTLRPMSLAKIVSVADGGASVKAYLQEMLAGNRMELLYRAFEQPFIPDSDEDVAPLINLGVLSKDDEGRVRATGKGIELCNILSHLVVNHRIKPPLEDLQAIFESFVRAGLWAPEDQGPTAMDLTVSKVLDLLSESGELAVLEERGIDMGQLRGVIRLYLCPPF